MLPEMMTSELILTAGFGQKEWGEGGRERERERGCVMGQTEKTTREGAERSRVKGAIVGRAETPGEMLLSLLPLSAFAACQSIALPPPPPSLALGRGVLSPPGQTSLSWSLNPCNLASPAVLTFPPLDHFFLLRKPTTSTHFWLPKLHILQNLLSPRLPTQFLGGWDQILLKSPWYPICISLTVPTKFCLTL